MTEKGPSVSDSQLLMPGRKDEIEDWRILMQCFVLYCLCGLFHTDRVAQTPGKGLWGNSENVNIVTHGKVYTSLFLTWASSRSSF